MRAAVFAVVVTLVMPPAVSAGPLRDAAERAAREVALDQPEPERQSRTRFWTGLGLIAGGAVLATLGSLELGDDESGPDDGEDFDDSDDGEDSDGWGNKALVGGGVAAATVGGIVLLTGRPQPRTTVSSKSGRVMVRHSVRF